MEAKSREETFRYNSVEMKTRNDAVMHTVGTFASNSTNTIGLQS